MEDEIFTNYANYYNTLRPETVSALRELAVPNLHFRDPFNDLHTVDATIRLLDEMFVDTLEPKFTVTHIAPSGDTAFLRWDFTFLPKSSLVASKKEPWKIVGVSEVRRNSAGKIVEHIDHWDSGRYFYEKLPLLGSILRLVRHRMATS